MHRREEPGQRIALSSRLESIPRARTFPPFTLDEIRYLPME
jgi:hypothetical protein